jgi:hypothetical protein
MNLNLAPEAALSVSGSQSCAFKCPSAELADSIGTLGKEGAGKYRGEIYTGKQLGRGGAGSLSPNPYAINP